MTSPLASSGTPSRPLSPNGVMLTGTIWSDAVMNAILHHSLSNCLPWPQIAHFGRKRLAHFLDLPRLDVPAEHAEDRTRSLDRADRLGVDQAVRNLGEEFRKRTLFQMVFGRTPLIEIETTHEQRQFCREMGREANLEAVAQSAQ